MRVNMITTAKRARLYLVGSLPFMAIVFLVAFSAWSLRIWLEPATAGGQSGLDQALHLTSEIRLNIAVWIVVAVGAVPFAAMFFGSRDAANREASQPYLKLGRLEDVLAALQVMGGELRPEGNIGHWARRLSPSDPEDKAFDRWNKVFDEHPEFFVTYLLRGEKKVALRWRYINRLYDPIGNAEYTPEQRATLSEEVRDRLTTKPLPHDAIGTLMSRAIELHARVLSEEAARRWWIPIMTAIFAFAAAILAAVLKVPGK
jgi:hypothetical protein